MPKAPTPTDTEELKAEIRAILAEAGRPMARDEITAVMALRFCAAHDLALAKLILEGKLTAELTPGAKDYLDADSYVLRAL